MFEKQIMSEKIRYGHIDDKVVDWCLQLIVSLVEDRGNEYSFSEENRMTLSLVVNALSLVET